MELVITQLTDLHVSGEKDLDILMSRVESIVGAISEVIRNPEETLLLICVTGDIAATGAQEQYSVAELFFEEIAQRIKDRFQEELRFQYAFIPGNHDCDFTSELVAVRETLIESKEIKIEDPSTMGICTSIQHNFFDFVDKFSEKGLCEKINRNSIFTENIINNEVDEDLKHWNIKLHLFNTAWCSKLHESKDMHFTVPKGLMKSKNDIVITMMHHGPNWFDWDGNDLWDEYHRENSDIILIGHDHKLNYVLANNYDNSTNYFIKGNQLYSHDEPDQSGFNIVKIDLEDNIERFYTYSWYENVYKKIISTNPIKFRQNRFKDSSINLKPEMRTFLEDIDADIINRFKSPLLLSDIFVFPVLQGEEDDKLEKIKTYRGQEEILNVIKSQKKVIINGGKEYGKTAFLKRLLMLNLDSGLFPIFLRGDVIKSADENEMNNLVRATYLATYNNINIDIIMQMSASNRVCLIDDFDGSHLSDKGRKRFLEYIYTQFDIVVLTFDSNNSMVEPVRNIETSEYLESHFYRLNILTMRRVIRYALIEKWLLLENSNQDIKSLEFQGKVKAKINEVQSVIKNGYFSNTPLDFLLVLSYIDNTQAINADYSKYSYIYDCLIKEKINMIAEQDTMKCSAYKTLLELLAYDLYEDGGRELFDEYAILKAINEYNEDYTRFKIKPTEIIRRLVQYQIIAERDDKYKFRFSYMYYYFAGSYIDNIMSPEEKTSKIHDILRNLYNETDFNIALFIAYSTNTEHVILPVVREIEASLLKEFEAANYRELCEKIGDVSNSILEKLDIHYDIPSNIDIPEIQKRSMERSDEQDEIESTNGNVKESNQGDSEKYENIFNDFMRLLRLIQFEGEVLKNYATKIRNQPRIGMIELMADSTMKLMGFFGSQLTTELDKIIDVVEKRVKSESEDKLPDKKILVQLIKDYMIVIWSQFVELNVSNLAVSLDTDMIKPDVYTIKEKKKSSFFDMVNVEYQFRISDSKLPIRDIEKCFAGNEKLDSFSSIIMRRIIASYLMSYQYDPIEKVKVCDILKFKFNHRDILLDDKQKEALGMID